MKANLRRSVETNRTRSNSRAVPHCQLVPHRGWPRVRRKSRCTISQLAYTPKKQFHVQQPTASYFKAYKLKRNCNFLMLLSKECFNLLSLSPAHPREIPRSLSQRGSLLRQTPSPRNPEGLPQAMPAPIKLPKTGLGRSGQPT
jgi:hypothetical protein